MKKIFSILLASVLLLSGCKKKIDEAIDDINGRLDAIENTQIASLQEQINSINTSINDLEKIDKEWGG